MGIQPVALLSHATGKVQLADPLQRNIRQEIQDRLPPIAIVCPSVVEIEQ
jgi:hypothetical protein